MDTGTPTQMWKDNRQGRGFEVDHLIGPQNNCMSQTAASTPRKEPSIQFVYVVPTVGTTALVGIMCTQNAGART